MRKDQVLFTYLHLAADQRVHRRAARLPAPPPSPTRPCSCPTARCRCWPRCPRWPAGWRPQVGAYHLMRQGGGRGVLMGGVPGVYAGEGRRHRRRRLRHERRRDRARACSAEVTAARPQRRPAAPDGRRSTRAAARPSPPTPTRSSRPCSTPTWSSARCWSPAPRRPKLVSNELVSRMKPGSVLVDIAIDQGGCFEDSRPTTHAEPTYTVHDSVFYCVANMPGAVPHTSTYALTNVTLPYARRARQPRLADALRARPRAGARPEHARGPAHQRPGRPRRTACRR